MSSHQELLADDLNDLINGNYEHISKTLFVIDHCFQENRNDMLQQITLNEFQQTKNYQMIKTYAKKYSINLNYRNEICIKHFGLKKKTEDLVIQFVKNKLTHMWYIDYAYLMVKEKKQNLDLWGFSPLSYELNFENLIQMQESKKLDKYLSLAKYGQLNKEFFDKNALEMSKECQLVYTDIIIYDNTNKVVDLIYFKFRRFPVGHQDKVLSKNKPIFKSGWLLIDCGSMKQYYSLGENLYIDYLLNRLNNNPDIKIKSANDNVFIRDIHKKLSKPAEKKDKKQ